MLEKYYNNIKRTMNKMSIWHTLLFILSIIFILLLLIKKFETRVEGFIQKEDFVVKKGTDIYDDFYANIYDELFFENFKNHYEVGSIINKTEPSEESLILDIGSGTGDTVGEFERRGHKVIGIDESQAMVNYAKDKYPKYDFRQANIMNAMLFSPESFTHITCLYFTLYYIQNKRMFFENCYRWLMPGGYLVIHLVNRDKFDPIVPAGNPLYMISPQRFAEKRITNSVVKFNNFKYKADFKIFPNDFAQFKEVFTDDKTGKVRQNIHKYYMPTQREILGIAKDTGFIMLGKVDLVRCQYEYQYLYILQKPT